MQASAAALPNTCAMLKAAHPQNSLGKGLHTPVGVYKPYGSPVQVGCTVKVGTLSVSRYLASSSGGGSGGVSITRETHPKGIGAGGTLSVGTLATGGPFDEIAFHRVGIYATLMAHGAAPSRLTLLARQVYAKL